ncbi:MAG: formyltransferase family protein [bacterium]
MNTVRTLNNIAIGVSGGGTTFEAIAKACASGEVNLTITFLFADRVCGAIDRAKRLGIKTILRNPEETIDEFHQRIVGDVVSHRVDIIVLAGYLRCFPITSNDKYMVINSHPGAIPYFGGKGMYGIHVHTAVLDWINKTGWVHPYTYSTVHIASEVYDKGQKLGIIALEVRKDHTSEMIAQNLLPLEHQNYIQVLKDLSEGKIENMQYPDSFMKLF